MNQRTNLKRLLSKKIGTIMSQEIIRYLFFGGCTTGVNLAVFTLLRYVSHMAAEPANLISIGSAVIFAFFVNRYLVFLHEKKNARTIVKEFLLFVQMRLGTFAVEYFGMILLSQWTKLPDLISKCMIQVIVIILNYFSSKYVVFSKRISRQ